MRKHCFAGAALVVVALGIALAGCGGDNDGNPVGFYPVGTTGTAYLITSITVFLATLALYVWGGEVINDFALCMLVGVVFGTYSSIYVASALALDTWIWLDRRKAQARRSRAA